MARPFPPLYVILDAAWPIAAESASLDALAAAGVELVQYRNKHAATRALYETSLALCNNPHISAGRMRFILNDRPDIAMLTGTGGVHVGQEDLGVEDARAIVGRDCWVGISTHTLEQLDAADRTSADYIAFGPVFSTTTKAKPDPVVGLAGLAAARARTRKPLVAIGGITLERAAEAYAAGADSLAVARDILASPNMEARARTYLETAAVILSRRSPERP